MKTVFVFSCVLCLGCLLIFVFEKRKQKTKKILTIRVLVFLKEVAAFKFEDTFAICY
jgi:hypothetical protein